MWQLCRFMNSSGDDHNERDAAIRVNSRSHLIKDDIGQ